MIATYKEEKRADDTDLSLKELNELLAAQDSYDCFSRKLDDLCQTIEEDDVFHSEALDQINRLIASNTRRLRGQAKAPHFVNSDRLSIFDHLIVNDNLKKKSLPLSSEEREFQKKQVKMNLLEDEEMNQVMRCEEISKISPLNASEYKFIGEQLKEEIEKLGRIHGQLLEARDDYTQHALLVHEKEKRGLTDLGKVNNL